MKAFVVFAIAFISVASAGSHGKPENYWKDFENGKIPHDALKVSQKGSDVPVYIGQGYFEGHGLLPGMLVAGENKLTVVADGRVLSIEHDIKIMCTDSVRPETNFQWISVHYQNFDHISKLGFLKFPHGGVEGHEYVFIGRHSESDYINIGKISTVEPYQGLNIPDSEGKPTVYKKFEALAMLNFDCDDESHRSSAGMKSHKSRTGRLSSWYGSSSRN